MTGLCSDSLLFLTTDGGQAPCSAEWVATELISGIHLDPSIVRTASNIVTRYVRSELGCRCITVDEFACALECVLIALGYEVAWPDNPPSLSQGQETPFVQTMNGFFFGLLTARQ